MKKLRILFLIFMTVLNLSSCATVKDEPIVTVGEENVVSGELLFLMAQSIETANEKMGYMSDSEKKEYWDKKIDGKNTVERIKEQSLQVLTDYALFTCEAKNNGITVSDSEVKARVNSVYPRETLKNLKNKYGVSEDAVRNVVRKQIFYQKYVQNILKNKEGYTPTEQQLLDLFYNGGFYKAQHILIMTVNPQTGAPYSKEEKEKAYETATAILDEVKGEGANFEAVMMEKSEDPGSKAQPDGYVFKDGDMVTEFYEGTKSLNEYEISDLVETTYGYHIIKRLPLSDSDMASKEEMLSNEYRQNYIEALSEELTEKYEVIKYGEKIKEVTVATGF